MLPLPDAGLYAITDCVNLNTEALLEKTRQILEGGAVMVQYRNKSNDLVVKQRQARKLQALCNQFDVPLIINDDPRLALNVDAAGVHIGREDMACKSVRNLIGPDRIMGVSCYNDLERAIAAEKEEADYVAFGSFFVSHTKPDAVIADKRLLATARNRLKIPIVAIGGVTPENAGNLIKAGADFIAASHALYDKNETEEMTGKFVRLFNQQKNNNGH